MSIKKISALIMMGLVLGAYAAHLQRSDGSRLPASTMPAPKTSGPYAHSLSGKLHRLFNIEVKAINGIPKENSQEIVLQAYVSPLSNPGEEVRYEWILPEGVEIVSGQRSDSWSNLQPGEYATAEISLLGLSEEDYKTVVFQAFTSVNGAQMGSTGAFSTHPLDNPHKINSEGLQKAQTDSEQKKPPVRIFQ